MQNLVSRSILMNTVSQTKLTVKTFNVHCLSINVTFAVLSVLETSSLKTVKDVSSKMLSVM